MAKYRDLDRGDVFPASFTDAIQEFIGTLTANLTVSLANSTTVQIVAGANSQQMAVGIDGLWRYRTTNATAAVTGAAGLKRVFLTTTANSFVSTPAPDTDTTDYTPALSVLDDGTVPTGVAAYREIANLDWDGSAITALRQTVGVENATVPLSPTAPAATVTPLIVRGAASQSADLLSARTSGGTDRLRLSPGGLLSLPTTGAGGGLQIGGDTTLYRASAGMLRTGGSLTVDGDATISGTLAAGSLSMAAGQQMTSAAGTAAAPGITFTGDTDTGLYSGGDGVVAFAGNGAATASLNADGRLALPRTGSTSGLLLGGDVPIYRSAAAALTVSAALIVGGTLAVTGAVSLTAPLGLGSGGLGVDASTAGGKTTARANLGLVIGTDVQAQNALLASITGLSANGLIARTAAGTAASRTITGTANQVTVTNGDGASGNPTLALPQDIHTAATPTFSTLTLNGTASAGTLVGSITRTDTGAVEAKALSWLLKADPPSASSGSSRAAQFTLHVPFSNSQNFTSGTRSQFATFAEMLWEGGGTVSGGLVGAHGQFRIGSGTPPVSQTLASVAGVSATSLVDEGSASINITSLAGVRVNVPVVTGATIATYAGIDVAGGVGAIASGITTGIGIRIGRSKTYGIQFSSTELGSTQGIWWGTDTNLYRSAADVLKTDDTFDALAFRQGGTAYPTVIHGQGTLAARPAAATANAGFLYYATDEQVLYRSDGATWTAWAGGGSGKYTTQIGDGTSTSIVVTHGLNTRNAVVYVYEAASPYRQVFPEIQHTSTTTTTLLFDAAPTSGQYNVVILSAAAASAASGAGIGSYVATIGNGVATSFTINHNLATRSVIVQAREAASPFAVVEPDIEITDPNFVTVRFASAPTTDQYVITVLSTANAAGITGSHASQHATNGSDALAARVVREVLDVGVVGQTRAGRVLTAADFTDLGLAAPVGLWNLSDLTDASGNARSLTNKGAVPFAPGIDGSASTAAQFAGSTAQALYISSASDAAAETALRIRSGSWGCWFKTARRGVTQVLLGKDRNAAGLRSWNVYVSSDNRVYAEVSPDGTGMYALLGVSDVADDCWHFAVATHDGSSTRLYVDGVLEGSEGRSFLLPANAGPFNIGASGADVGTAASFSHYGRVDEAFVTADVLSEDQIRMLYAVKVPHGLTLAPIDAKVTVRRRRKGPLLASSDFSAAPLRLYNLAPSTGSGLTDVGSQATAATASGSVLTAPGPNGLAGGGLYFDGSSGYLSASDTTPALPSGTASRSFGAWFKTASTSSSFFGIVGYGTSAAPTFIQISNGTIVVTDGTTNASSSPAYNDGIWHFAVAVVENTPVDGLRKKLYIDGRLVATDTALVGVTPAGATGFRVGVNAGGNLFFPGLIARAFVTNYAMDAHEVMALYAKGSQTLASSPKNAGDHIEGFDATNLYVIGDTLESQHRIELGVGA